MKSSTIHFIVKNAAGIWGRVSLDLGNDGDAKLLYLLETLLHEKGVSYTKKEDFKGDLLCRS